MDKLTMTQKWLVGAGAVVFLLLTGILQSIVNAILSILYFGGMSVLVLLPVALVGWLIWWVATAERRMKKKNEECNRETLDSILRSAGATKEERSAYANKKFDERQAEIKITVERVWRGWYIKVPIGRSLSSMSTRDREVLRASILLYNEGLNRSVYNSFVQILGIVYGDGRATIYGGEKRGLVDKTIKQALDWIVEGDGLEPSVDLALSELNEAVKKHPDNPTVQALAARLLGNGSDLQGQAGLTSASIDALPENFLIIGRDTKSADRVLGFAGEGSLLTVAPAGSGKTQCHVIPNLLTWKGPAVVLDIKGELHASTSAWRAANVGPIFKFSPLDPEQGHSYNPFLAVSDDPDHIWEDSRFLADMLIVPSSKTNDPFWEGRGRDVLTAAIAFTVRNHPPETRTMQPVLDILNCVGWDSFIISLEATSDVPSMSRTGRSLGEMEAKMRDSVLQTALASLSAWEGARIARATKASDWTPAELRSGRNPTIYICIKPNEIDSYASMLRVIIAQHIRALTSSLPERGGPPILFFLDELPRLRNMPPVAEALEIGRQYGIKLWIFAQSFGQLKTSYENADGMAANCVVRCFMNPSLQDGTAQKLSDDLGFRESIVDGSRVKRVEPNVLAGPSFTDKVIVMTAGADPGCVAKHYAHSDPELVRRMEGAPVTTVQGSAHG